VAFSLIGVGRLILFRFVYCIVSDEFQRICNGAFNTGIYSVLRICLVFVIFFLEPLCYEPIFLGSFLVSLPLLFVKLKEKIE
jgi:hypothetical protein